MLTLKELKKIVKVADVEKRIPSVKSLKEHKVVVKEMINADTTISVYDHGYVLYTAGNQSTVFPLHSCDDYEYVSVTGDNKEFNKEFFDNENWYIRLLIEAEDRMAYSQSKISTNHGVFSNSDVTDDVELNNRIVCFDIKELGKQLKKIGMLIVQDQVWNRVTINRGIKSTRYYIDEFHLLLKEEQTAAYSVEIWKRFRKWGGIPSGITQNIKDLLASREIENIFENSDFILMLNQAAGDRQILAKQLNISPYQLSYVTNSREGEGLLFYGTTIIPFKDKFDKNLKLYSLMTTKPEEVEKREKEMEAEKHEGNR